jgi:hypothetical protein
MTHLQITERKDNGEYRAIDVDDVFRGCEKKRAEQGFFAFFAKPLLCATDARSPVADAC